MDLSLNYVVDVSSFFLIESSGDSEQELDLNVCIDLDEDDAESRSCDISCIIDREESFEMDHHDQNCGEEEDGEHDCIHNHGYGYENPTWKRRLLLPDHMDRFMEIEVTKKPSDDDNEVNVGEEDNKDRSFWDACLAL
ncbi:hypothetical protein AQUCO_00800088v1 [Aquilegia coerulea]|uniref:Uncharacterized protein n=1 Tax=Aquilegia coerulea TaxID=218851 RepID=A0A2G5EHD9_AQUCA|nr:hypothetical protein AQUCO_00800088v1 [Aquilegia coerulea]